MIIVLHGRPITKKNSMRIFRGRVMQSKAYCDYEAQCLMQLRMLHFTTITEPVTVCCKYWMDSKRSKPDLVNLLQATSDILEKSTLIENDRNIISYDGSRIMGIDKDDPRVEIEITTVRG